MEYGTMNDEQKKAFVFCTIAFIAGWIVAEFML
jgi:hypothetical protein